MLFGLKEYFDTIVNSADEGRFKSADSFATAKKYLRGNMRDALLLDNSIENCALFKRSGGDSRHVTPEYSLDYFLEELL